MVWRVAVALAALVVAGCAEAPAPEPSDIVAGHLFGVVVTEAIVPIAGAEVHLPGTDWSNTTDAAGEFRLGPIEPGSYKLSVRAEGYTASTLAVTVAAGEDSRVNVVLQAASTSVPYHEVEHFSAYVECSYAQRFAGAVGGNFNCLGITDLLLGIKLDNDKAAFPFDVRGDGFAGLLVEMVWDPQATMPNWSGYLRDVVEVGGGVGLEGQYWSAVGESPIVGWVYQGTENQGAYSGDVFHPDANESREYEISVAGMTDTTKPVDVAVALQQELEIFVSKFYNALPGEGYGIVTG